MRLVLSRSIVKDPAKALYGLPDSAQGAAAGVRAVQEVAHHLRYGPRHRPTFSSPGQGGKPDNQTVPPRLVDLHVSLVEEVPYVLVLAERELQIKKPQL